MEGTTRGRTGSSRYVREERRDNSARLGRRPEVGAEYICRVYDHRQWAIRSYDRRERALISDKGILDLRRAHRTLLDYSREVIKWIWVCFAIAGYLCPHVDNLQAFSGSFSGRTYQNTGWVKKTEEQNGTRGISLVHECAQDR